MSAVAPVFASDGIIRQPDKRYGHESPAQIEDGAPVILGGGCGKPALVHGMKKQGVVGLS